MTTSLLGDQSGPWTTRSPTAAACAALTSGRCSEAVASLVKRRYVANVDSPASGGRRRTIRAGQRAIQMLASDHVRRRPRDETPYQRREITPIAVVNSEPAGSIGQALDSSACTHVVATIRVTSASPSPGAARRVRCLLARRRPLRTPGTRPPVAIARSPATTTSAASRRQGTLRTGSGPCTGLQAAHQPAPEQALHDLESSEPAGGDRGPGAGSSGHEQCPLNRSPPRLRRARRSRVPIALQATRESSIFIQRGAHHQYPLSDP